MRQQRPEPGTLNDPAPPAQFGFRLAAAAFAATFTLTRGTVLLATVLTGLSMLLYPGGTALDPTTRGYSFFGNSLSDLGSTVAWDGQANAAGAMLFMCGFCVVAIGCGACAAAMVRLFSASSASRTSARAGAVLGLLSCAALGVVLGVWLCVTRTMPSTATGFAVAVTLQKLVAITLVATLWLQAGEGRRIARGETHRWLNDEESL